MVTSVGTSKTVKLRVSRKIFSIGVTCTNTIPLSAERLRGRRASTATMVKNGRR